MQIVISQFRSLNLCYFDLGQFHTYRTWVTLKCDPEMCASSYTDTLFSGSPLWDFPLDTLDFMDCIFSFHNLTGVSLRGLIAGGSVLLHDRGPLRVEPCEIIFCSCIKNLGA